MTINDTWNLNLDCSCLIQTSCNTQHYHQKTATLTEDDTVTVPGQHAVCLIWLHWKHDLSVAALSSAAVPASSVSLNCMMAASLTSPSLLGTCIIGKWLDP